jgi:predicted dehydrogenase
MIEKEKPDAIICSVSTTETMNLMKRLIPFRIPILVEKPPGLSVRDTEQLAELAKVFRTSIMVAFNRRFYSVVEQAKHQIAESGGLLGMRVDGFERYRLLRETGYPPESLERLLTTNTIHCIDLIRYYAGDILDINVFNNNLNEEPFNHRYAAMIETRSHIPVTFQAYWHSLGNWSYELYVPNGKISFNNLEEGVVRRGNEGIQALKPLQEDVEAKPGFVRMLQYFSECVIGDSAMYEGRNSIFDAVSTMDLVDRISRS